MLITFPTHSLAQCSGTLIIATHSFWNKKSNGSGLSIEQIIKESTHKYFSSTKPESVGNAIRLAQLDTTSKDISKSGCSMLFSITFCPQNDQNNILLEYQR
ncbi:hypothetical protein BT96DRAFT_699884 [Gymnopus androsaceus JB14]|uniref:Uncharacterized protein n=1 Tax=Gymnopus androsaceus JB14 TaxID=1447944 RepID=A0A6A4ID38_9AGAR|nr:hypothetical protein BT96DRAFT_699884 [Gymnopus androsaceus JB14]